MADEVVVIIEETVDEVVVIVEDTVISGNADMAKSVYDPNTVEGDAFDIANMEGVVSQAEAEAGTATTKRIWTAERVKQAIDALGGGGGGEINYNHFCFIDAASTVNWTALGIGISPNLHDEYYYNTSVSNTLSPATMLDSTLSTLRHFALIASAQTVKNIVLSCGRESPGNLKGLAILRVRYSDISIPTMSDKTIIYQNNNITIPASGFVNIADTDCDNTDLAQGDILIAFFYSTTTGNVGYVRLSMNTTVN